MFDTQQCNKRDNCLSEAELDRIFNQFFEATTESLCRWFCSFNAAVTQVSFLFIQKRNEIFIISDLTPLIWGFNQLVIYTEMSILNLILQQVKIT